MPILLTAFIAIADVLALGILQIVFNINSASFIEETPFRLLGIIVSKMVLIVLVYTCGMFSKKDQSSIPLAYSLCILSIPFICMICMITIIQYVMQPTQADISPIWFAFSAVGLLFISLLVIFLFEALKDYSRNQSQYHLMAQQVELLGNHLRERNALQEETHHIWHDMKNHFTVIQWMVKSKNYEKLDQYMITLNETVTNSMLRIQSGNPILDALFNAKAAEAKKHGIVFNVTACVPANISIEDIDLNIIFSNALDNAVEACKKLPEGKERTIDIDTHIKNDHLILIMKNSFDGHIRMSGDELKTTKNDSGRHGIGIGNMKRSAEKYDGHVMTKVDENVFILSIALYCKISKDEAV